MQVKLHDTGRGSTLSGHKVAIPEPGTIWPEQGQERGCFWLMINCKVT